MPIVKTVSVNYERKINTGDYSSATVGCTLWADIEVDETGKPTEDLNLVMHDLWSMAKANVKTQALPLINKANNEAEIERAFLGLPVKTGA
jgi:hypothetical protein